MLKNLIENAKLTAQKVINKPAVSLESLPTFEQLAQRNFFYNKENLWKYSTEELAQIINQMDDYLGRLQRGYIETAETFQPLFSKFDLQEKERRKQAQELEEKETLCKQLELAMIEMQSDADSELRKREMLESQVESLKKDLQALQSQVNWNNQMDEKEILDFKEALIELDKSQDDHYKLRMEVLQKEIQEQIKLKNDSFTRAQSLQLEAESLKDQNRNLNQNIKMLLGQFAELQARTRQEIEQRSAQVTQLAQQNSHLKQQLEESERRHSMSLRIEVENTKLQEQLNSKDETINQKQKEISGLQAQVREKEKHIKELNDQISVLKQKRDLAINEIAQLSTRMVTPESSYSISQQKLKQIRYSLQSRLIQMRKEFEQMYKKYMILVCRVVDQELMKEMLHLEGVVNGIVIGVQNLIDEIEDIMD